MKSKVKDYIRSESQGSVKKRDEAIFNHSENMGSIMRYSSNSRSNSFDCMVLHGLQANSFGMFNTSFTGSEGGFWSVNGDKLNTSNISLLNEGRHAPTIYANKDCKSLGNMLNYGYSHRF